MFKSKAVVISALVLLMAVGATASSFRSADVVYLPVAGKVAGGNNSFFRTDVWIANPNTSPVEVFVAYAARGADNANAPADAKPITPVLAPGERREIVDIFSSVFQTPDTPGALGQLIFFSCRQGGNCDDCNLNSADCLPVTVEARIYTTAADGSTFGQLIPGNPWYMFISPNAVDQNLSQVFISGIRQTGEYRTNIGLANVSQNSSATIRARLFNSTGTQIGSTFEKTLPPLGMDQMAITQMFPGFSGTGAWVLLEQLPISSGSDPGFFAYGSLLDNRSNDPTYLEAQYLPQMDYNCIFGSKPARRPAQR